MALNDTVHKVTERIVERSQDARGAYLDKISRAADAGVKRAHLTCGNQAHAYAAMSGDKDALVAERAPNIGIVTAYNDMLSAHQPYATFPDQVKSALAEIGVL